MKSQYFDKTRERGGQRDLAPFVVDSYAMAWMDKNVYL